MSVPAMLPFGIRGQNFLVAAHYVREILGEVSIVDVPRADVQVPGVFLWNGQAVPMMDLPQILRLPGGDAEETGGRRRTLVARIEGETVGFRADQLSEVVHIDVAALREARVCRLPFVQSEIELEGGVWPVLDLHGLVALVMNLTSQHELSA